MTSVFLFLDRCFVQSILMSQLPFSSHRISIPPPTARLQREKSRKLISLSYMSHNLLSRIFLFYLVMNLSTTSHAFNSPQLVLLSKPFLFFLLACRLFWHSIPLSSGFNSPSFLLPASGFYPASVSQCFIASDALNFSKAHKIEQLLSSEEGLKKPE